MYWFVIISLFLLLFFGGFLGLSFLTHDVIPILALPIFFIALAFVLFIIIFNKLVSLRNQVKNSWSQIDVQLQRRYDLIPNLVETVKGYMKHEKETLQNVIEARNKAVSVKNNLSKEGGPAEGASLDELAKAEDFLKRNLTNIFALAENYPNLYASENIKYLQEELTSTENKVAFARQAYNDNVMAYNNLQQQFPSNLIASLFGHKPVSLFEVEYEGVRKAPKVDF